MHLLIIWKNHCERSQKKSYFQKNYASSKAKELKALLNPIPVLLCIINVFPFNERLNSKYFLSYQQNSNLSMQYSLFIPAIPKKFLKITFKLKYTTMLLKNSLAEPTLHDVQAIQITNYKVLFCIIVSTLDRLQR